MELCHTATRSGRLSSFLRGEMNMSAGLVNRLKWSHRILVNGEPRHNDFQVSPGDVICALLDDPQPEYPAENGDLWHVSLLIQIFSRQQRGLMSKV